MSKKYVAIIIGVVILSGGLWWLNTAKNQSGDNPSGTETTRTGASLMNIASLPEAKPSESVTLKDGEVFDMNIVPVKKNINGQWVKMLGYNGMVPGPALTVPQGATVTVRLKNSGDIATTLHSHGVRMDNAFDGVPDVTQKAIQSGETFEYKLKFPDTGAYWYHPHVRTDYTLEAGLYGNYIVTPSDTAYWSPVDREVPIMLDDIALDKQGLLPFSKETADHALMGRFGNVMLTNGETDYRMSAKQGEVVRLYLTDAANTRVFNFTIPGAKMKLVGADLGRYAKEAFVDEVLIGPGERRVVDVLFEQSGELAMIHKTPGKRYTLGKISVSSDAAARSYAKEFEMLRTDESVVTEAENIQQSFGAKNPDKKLTITLDMNGAMRNMMGRNSGHMGGGHMMSDGSEMSGHDMGSMGMGDDGGVIEWEDTMNMMNRQSTAKTLTWKLTDGITGKSNMDVTDWTFKTGDKVKIRLFNDPQSMHPMQHPIHFHGQRFMALSTNGVKNANPVWQDTALIPKGDTVDILLDASNPGRWMAHCHILEHAESGMMIPFKVE